MLKIKKHRDAGHGWYAVKRDLLYKLDIASKISSYSYERGNSVYCEEDCDASLLLDALDQAKISYEIIYLTGMNRSPIRVYDHYQNRDK